MKLWQKENTNTAALTEKFTVGKDREFDLLLAAYDVEGSLAHTEMLFQVGLLKMSEKDLIHTELKRILEEIKAGKFIIEDDVEIGSNTSIDRGTLGNTIIREGAKIDNLVHRARIGNAIVRYG